MLLVQSLKDWFKNWRTWKLEGEWRPNNCIVTIGQNTEKSPVIFRRHAVTQTSVRNHRLTLVGKTWKGVMIIIANWKILMKRRGRYVFQPEIRQHPLTRMFVLMSDTDTTANDLSCSCSVGQTDYLIRKQANCCRKSVILELRKHDDTLSERFSRAF